MNDNALISRMRVPAWNYLSVMRIRIIALFFCCVSQRRMGLSSKNAGKIFYDCVAPHRGAWVSARMGSAHLQSSWCCASQRRMGLSETSPESRDNDGTVAPHRGAWVKILPSSAVSCSTVLRLTEAHGSQNVEDSVGGSAGTVAPHRGAGVSANSEHCVGKAAKLRSCRRVCHNSDFSKHFSHKRRKACHFDRLFFVHSQN